MNEGNWLLVTNDQVEFENDQLKFEAFWELPVVYEEYMEYSSI